MRRQDGFTLLEVLIALAMLIVGVGALAQLSIVAIRAADDARRASVASVAADQKLETLAALSWGYDDAGATVQDRAFDASPADSLTRNTDGYFEYLDAAGRVVDEDDEDGTDGRAFVRRWSIQPLPEHPLTTIVIEVLVVASLAGADPPPSQALRLGARRLTIRTRRSPGSAS
jgi:type II secretory pathway pseudopilin PulG